MGGKENRVENNGHRYWRKGMNAVSKDASDKDIHSDEKSDYFPRRDINSNILISQYI